VSDLLLVFLEPHEQTLPSYLELILHEVEIVGLLAHVVARVDGVHHLQTRVVGRLKHSELRLHVLVFLEFAVLVDYEVLGGVLCAKDLQKVRERLA